MRCSVHSGVPQVVAGVGAQVACGLFLMTALQTAVTHTSTHNQNTRNTQTPAVILRKTHTDLLIIWWQKMLKQDTHSFTVQRCSGLQGTNIPKASFRRSLIFATRGQPRALYTNTTIFPFNQLNLPWSSGAVWNLHSPPQLLIMSCLKKKP